MLVAPRFDPKRPERVPRVVRGIRPGMKMYLKRDPSRTGIVDDVIALGRDKSVLRWVRGKAPAGLQKGDVLEWNGISISIDKGNRVD